MIEQEDYNINNHKINLFNENVVGVIGNDKPLLLVPLENNYFFNSNWHGEKILHYIFTFIKKNNQPLLGTPIILSFKDAEELNDVINNYNAKYVEYDNCGVIYVIHCDLLSFRCQNINKYLVDMYHNVFTEYVRENLHSKYNDFRIITPHQYSSYSEDQLKNLEHANINNILTEIPNALITALEKNNLTQIILNYYEYDEIKYGILKQEFDN